MIFLQKLYYQVMILKQGIFWKQKVIINILFEVVEINNISATCISLYSTRGLQKGSIVIKKNDGLEVEYSDKILGRVFDSYGDVIDGLPFESEKKVKVSHTTVTLKDVKVEKSIMDWY